MDIYVSGRVNNRESCSMLMRLLEAKGHNITFDWTKYGVVLRRDADKLAAQEVQGVFDADVVIVNNVDDGGLGCWIEVGIALGHAIPVVLYGKNRYSTFWELDGFRNCYTVEQLLNHLEHMENDT